MRRVLKREAARRDLIDLFVWYAENASPAVADRFLSSAETTLKHLAAAPASGARIAVTRPELEGLRRWPVKGFERVLLFYFPLPDGLDLIRAVHGSRDLERLFEGPQPPPE